MAVAGNCCFLDVAAWYLLCPGAGTPLQASGHYSGKIHRWQKRALFRASYQSGRSRVSKATGDAGRRFGADAASSGTSSFLLGL